MGPMRPTAQHATFAADPVGRALIGDGWMHFCAEPELFGIVFWGRPGGDAIEALVRSLKVELGPGVPPHRSLVDARRLEATDLGAFEVMRRYVVGHAEPLSSAVTRLALVRPDGLVGAMTAGFYQVSEQPYPVEVVAGPEEGLAWLGADPALAVTLDALVDQTLGAPTEVARLRAWLAENLREGDLAGAARALGLSARTLQRRLSAEDTTFARELVAARLQVAQRRMLQTDEPLSTIAYGVGFSSQQHFSTAFRKATGTTPSAWRAARG